MSAWNRAGPIVVEVDGGAEHSRAVDYAVDEALRCGAELRLVAVSGEGSRAQVLVDAAKDARMIVVSRARRLGPTNPHEHLTLAARAGCPVVVVPASWMPSSSDRKVAVGIDGTALSEEALEFAFSTAAARQAELVVVHSGLPLSEALAHWTRQFPAVKVTRFLSSRQPAAALVRESSDVGLVVVGCHGGQLPIDPVARRSVAAMISPVAIVPHLVQHVVPSR